MSDLPEMLRGSIAEEYPEVSQPVFLSEEEHKTHSSEGCHLPQTNAGKAGCTISGKTCPIPCKPEITRAGKAFQPMLAGWWTPPAPHIR